jgi:hypothetical protein
MIHLICGSLVFNQRNYYTLILLFRIVFLSVIDIESEYSWLVNDTTRICFLDICVKTDDVLLKWNANRAIYS